MAWIRDYLACVKKLADVVRARFQVSGMALFESMPGGKQIWIVRLIIMEAYFNMAAAL